MLKDIKNKVLPYSIDAERSVIGALMLEEKSWDLVSDILNVSDFYFHENRLIFQAMGELSARNQALDCLTVSEILKQKKQLDIIGGENYLFQLVQNTPNASNIASYAKVVSDYSTRRMLISSGTSIVNNAFESEGKDIEEVLDFSESSIFQISEQRDRLSGPVPVSSLLAKTTDKIDELYRSGKSITGISTGFHDFDEITSGLQRGDLIIIAGRPSMGKTVFGVNIAENVVIKDKKVVLFFSMEMPGESIVMRLLSSIGRTDQHRIRTGRLNDSDWPKITAAINTLSSARLFIDDTPALSLNDLRSRSRRLSRTQGGLDLIIVDYLQLMRSSNKTENRTIEVSEISRTLKAIAKELMVPVVALSQLNRSLESRINRRPIMSDLRESGSLEQDADIILFIYRDEVYNEDSPDKGIAELIIRKHRNGQIGDFKLSLLGEYARFENFSYRDFER